MCRDKSQYLIMQRIAELDFVFPDDFSDEAIDLISRLLVEEPSDRLGYDSLQHIKEHAFFEGVLMKRLSRPLLGRASTA